jgi:pyruvate/2-oxoglutarate dehydrogenase complex dihydrolipoamide acyltransferase (E2) component
MRTRVNCPPIFDVGTITLTKRLKNYGDQVAREEEVAEITTDKSVMDVSSPMDGYCAGWWADEGDTLIPGQQLMEIDTEPPPSRPYGS